MLVSCRWRRRGQTDIRGLVTAGRRVRLEVTAVPKLALDLDCPFEHFHENQAIEMLAAVNRLVLRVAEAVEEDHSVSAAVSLDSLAVTNWGSIEFPPQGEPLSRAFGLDSKNLCGAQILVHRFPADSVTVIYR